METIQEAIHEAVNTKTAEQTELEALGAALVMDEQQDLKAAGWAGIPVGKWGTADGYVGFVGQCCETRKPNVLRMVRVVPNLRHSNLSPYEMLDSSVQDKAPHDVWIHEIQKGFAWTLDEHGEVVADKSVRLMEWVFGPVSGWKKEDSVDAAYDYAVANGVFWNSRKYPKTGQEVDFEVMVAFQPEMLDKTNPNRRHRVRQWVKRFADRLGYRLDATQVERVSDYVQWTSRKTTLDDEWERAALHTTKLVSGLVAEMQRDRRLQFTPKFYRALLATCVELLEAEHAAAEAPAKPADPYADYPRPAMAVPDFIPNQETLSVLARAEAHDWRQMPKAEDEKFAVNTEMLDDGEFLRSHPEVAAAVARQKTSNHY